AVSARAPPDLAAGDLPPLRRCGACLPSGHAPAEGLDLVIGPHDTWDDVLAKLPPGWLPDLVALRLGYATVPPGLWEAPLPLVGLAQDWTWQWHHYLRVLPLCDLVLTDRPGVAALARAGISHALPANLYGVGPRFVGGAPGQERDIDILFIGNLHPAVQRERQPWLGRVARLAARRNVVIASGVFGDAYRALLRRAKIVFNRSARGEANMRCFEAAAS